MKLFAREKSTVELVRRLRLAVKGVLSFPEIPPNLPRDQLEERLAVRVSQGTAFSISANRFLTCHHVIENLNVSRLKLVGSLNPEGGPPLIMLDIVDVRSDPELDIALLTTNEVRREMVPITFQPGPPKVGLDILAVGYPLPEQRRPELIENERRINVAVHHTFRAVRGIVASRLADNNRFEIDKLLNPGQSGGPVVSIESGKLVGICEAFREYPGQNRMMPSDLSVCVSADAVRNKLSEWGCL